MSSAIGHDRPIPDYLTGLYRRFKNVIHEGAKFGIVGLTGIFVTNLVFGPLHDDLHLGVLTSVTIATCVATVWTFLGNRYWSFRHREGKGTGRDGVAFFILNGIGLLIQYAVLGFGDYALGLTTKLDNYVALNLGICLGTLFRFWSYRKWIWLPPEAQLARLRRGRHRKGRTAPVPPPPAAVTAARPARTASGASHPQPPRLVPDPPAPSRPPEHPTTPAGHTRQSWQLRSFSPEGNLPASGELTNGHHNPR